MVYKKKNKVAFTLTELIITVLFMFAVSTVVVYQALNQSSRKADVEKVKSTYELLERATMAWQAENGCYDDVRVCIQKARAKGVPNSKIFNGVAQYLPVVASSVDINAKGRHVNGESLIKIDWLPEETKSMDGNAQLTSTMGVSKLYDGKNKDIAYYMLRNGVTIAVNFSEYGSNTGYGFFDINGKEGMNRIGYDVYPFSIGAMVPDTNPVYEKTAKKISPFFASRYVTIYDLCNINKDTCSNDKLATNPTVYVLKWNKLP